MANRKEISDAQKARGFLTVCAIILFFIIACWYHEKKVDYIRKHGIWTILTVTNKEVSWRGYEVYYYFQYDNHIQRNMEIMTDIEAESGNRFFMMIVPEEESKYFISDAVPDWFTLEPPPEGWKRRPTVRKMRRLMVEDSIRRGLKEKVKRDW